MRNDNNTYQNHHMQSFATIREGQWHHVTWVDASGTVSLYGDGVTHHSELNIPNIPARVRVGLGAAGERVLEPQRVGDFLEQAVDFS